VKRHGDACHITVRDRFERLISRVVPRVRSMLPSYTPHAYRVPARIGKLSAQFSALAESTT
jgi:hypothetical protein